MGSDGKLVVETMNIHVDAEVDFDLIGDPEDRGTVKAWCEVIDRFVNMAKQLEATTDGGRVNIGTTKGASIMGAMTAASSIIDVGVDHLKRLQKKWPSAIKLDGRSLDA